MTIGNTPPGSLTVSPPAPVADQPSTAPGASTSITVSSYRDAWVSAQLAVHGTGGHLEGVTVTVASDLSDRKRPKELAAGTYTGSVHVASTVGLTFDVPISVTV